MPRVLLVLAIVAVTVYALVEAAQTPANRTPLMPRWLWFVAIVALPEAAGGMGLGLRELTLLQEQMGYHLACVPFFDAVVALTPLWKALSQTEQGLPLLMQAFTGQPIPPSFGLSRCRLNLPARR